jgi:RNAse (barnase) inhibitor barstar
MSKSAPAITAKRAGVYRAPAEVTALTTAASKAEIVWMTLPLGAVANKKQFFAVCEKQMKLPSYFGGNWDALADCVRDFNWLSGKGYVLHLTGPEKFAKAAVDDYQTAIDVLTEAAEFWKSKDTPFIVLVDGGKDLPAF